MHTPIPYTTGPHPKKTQVALLELSRDYRVSFRFCMRSGNSLMVSKWALAELMAEEQKRQLPVPGGMECSVCNADINRSVSGTISGSATIEAVVDNLTVDLYRHELLHAECKAQAERCKKSLLPQASFSLSQSLWYLSWEGLPMEAQKPLPLGVSLEYIHRDWYLFLIGNIGSIRPQTALSQGTKAVCEGSLVWFILDLRMLPRTSENRSEKSRSNREEFVENNDPAIGDAIGDIACDQEGSALLVNRRPLMAAHKSKIRATSRSFDRWHEVFKAPALPTASIDSLIRPVCIINLTSQTTSIKEISK